MNKLMIVLTALGISLALGVSFLQGEYYGKLNANKAVDPCEISFKTDTKHIQVIKEENRKKKFQGVFFVCNNKEYF
jgi:hypothetical protein